MEHSVSFYLDIPQKTFLQYIHIIQKYIASNTVSLFCITKLINKSFEIKVMKMCPLCFSCALSEF